MKIFLKRIRKEAAFLFAIIIIMSGAVSADALTAAPELFAEAAVLIDADTGQILYGKNENAHMQPASLTKLMTCLLALDYGKPEELITMTAEALRLMPGSSTAGIAENEQLTMEQMLYAMMLPSANEAANAIGIHIAGSINGFVKAMNDKLEELGLTDSHFSNTNGLPARSHYASAYDLAMITRAALNYEDFTAYAGAGQYSIAATEHNTAHSFTHTNRMLRSSTAYYNESAVAGKTGWTYPAGNCLMTVFRRDGRTLIGVVLKSDSDKVLRAVYSDMESLYNYGYEEMQRYALSYPAQAQSATGIAPDGTQHEITLNAEAATIEAWLPAGFGSSSAKLGFHEDIVISEGLQEIEVPVYAVSDEIEWEWPIGSETVYLTISEVIPIKATAVAENDDSANKTASPPAAIAVLYIVGIAGFLYLTYQIYRSLSRTGSEETD